GSLTCSSCPITYQATRPGRVRQLLLMDAARPPEGINPAEGPGAHRHGGPYWRGRRNLRYVDTSSVRIHCMLGDMQNMVRRIIAGRRLRVLRVGKKLSGRAAAAEVHRAPSTLSAWETGQELIDINILRNLVTHVYGADRTTLASLEDLLYNEESDISHEVT